MNDIVTAVLALATGVGAGAVAEAIRSKAQNKTADTTATAEVTKAEIAGDGAAQDRFLKRIDLLETQVAKCSELIDKLQERTNQRERELERVANAYEGTRRLIGRVAARIERGDEIGPELICEMKDVPHITVVLVGPLDTARATQSPSQLPPSDSAAHGDDSLPS